MDKVRELLFEGFDRAGVISDVPVKPFGFLLGRLEFVCNRDNLGAFLFPGGPVPFLPGQRVVFLCEVRQLRPEGPEGTLLFVFLFDVVLNLFREFTDTAFVLFLGFLEGD